MLYIWGQQQGLSGCLANLTFNILDTDIWNCDFSYMSEVRVDHDGFQVHIIGNVQRGKVILVKMFSKWHSAMKRPKLKGSLESLPTLSWHGSQRVPDLEEGIRLPSAGTVTACRWLRCHTPGALSSHEEPRPRNQAS